MIAGSPRSRPLRVVFLGHSAVLSGAELGLVELIAAFEDVEARVLLAEDGPLVERLEAVGGIVELMPLSDKVRLARRQEMRLRGLHAVSSGAATAAYSTRLARRLLEVRADLVHANTLKALVYGAAAARLARIPLIWHAHDRISRDYLPPEAVRILRGLARHAASGVIANSESTLSTLGRIDKPAAIVSEPVRHQSFGGRPRERSGQPFTVAMVGRIAPWKGQDVFLRAFASAFPTGDERGVLIGAPLFGEEAYERSLRRLIARLGLRDRVEFRGFREDVGAELARVDLLVHASVIPEPFGRVIVEGMAAGLPVVATRGGGPTEIITDGVDGLLYPSGDTRALGEILSRLSADRELAAALGRAATRRAGAFSPERAARATTDLYERVLQTSGTRWR